MGLGSFLTWDIGTVSQARCPGLFRCCVKTGATGSLPAVPLHFEV